LIISELLSPDIIGIVRQVPYCEVPHYSHPWQNGLSVKLGCQWSRKEMGAT